MPIPLSTNEAIEKNKLTSNSVWHILLSIEQPGENAIRVCLNNENVVWNGNTYIPAVFTLSGITENKNAEIPSIPLSFHDPTRIITSILEEHDGAIGAVVNLYIVHSKFLTNTTPQFQENFTIIDTVTSDDTLVTFKLGAEDLSSTRCPKQRFLKNNCRFIFKGPDGRCGYVGPENDCNRSFARCRELGNQRRFGGFPGVGVQGIFS